MKLKISELCYFCGAPATSREHVPPKCIFPEKEDIPGGLDLRKNLIKVPSCSVHNLSKSKEDEYLMVILALNILNNKIGNDQALTKIRRAFLHSKKLAATTLKKTLPFTLKEIQSGQLEKAVGFEVDNNRLDLIFEHIARGIFYFHYKERVNKPIKVFNESYFIYDENDRKKTIEFNNELEKIRNASNAFFYNKRRYGGSEKVFFYQIERDASKAIIRLTFYENAHVSCLIRF